ncbi:MAG: hypothetical protein WC198_06505, partial [Victivallaceae bacterium]
MADMNDKLTTETIQFQPDAIELKNARLPLWARLCVFLPLLILGGAIAWAYLGKVDVIVQAGGKLITDKQVI